MPIFSVFYLKIEILTKSSAAMEKMASCRNFIVHNYDKIDAEIIVSILKKNLPDFEAFKTAVLSVLEQ